MNVIDTEETYTANYYHPHPLVVVKGQDVWLWDDKGNKYLDMMAAYSAVSHGHSHPRILKVLQTQAATLAVPSRQFYSDKLGALMQKLTHLSGLDKGMPANSGAEAVEAAVKAARQWGYRVKGIPDNKAEIIVADGNFHGRTTTVISFSSNDDYKKDFGPLTPGFKIVEFGNAKAVEDAITDNTCAVLFEPIQGENGIVIPPKGFHKDLRNVCTKNNVLLIWDEIQSGLGRTGKMFCFEHEHATPDILILGKALGGGMLPVSAVLGTHEVMDLWDWGSHGSTYGGNPLACAVAIEALNVLEDENMIEKSAEMGAYLLEQMKTIDSPLVKEFRGLGLWVGMHIDIEKVTGRDIAMKLMDKGVLTKETRRRVLRFSPPLTIQKDHIDFTVEKVKESLSELEK